MKRLALILLASCNALLGIDGTVADTDGDGVPDATDNCRDVINPNQFDSNGDGQGDACSFCARPSGRDLDGDGYDDRCDLCIGSGLIGEDADADAIDDGCDPCIGRTGTTHVDVAPADGIDDGCTICRTPVGEDFDADGYDDGCDLCLGGPPHDEDGDGADDGCDNCPFDANAGQVVVADDGDTLGEACDPDELLHHVRVFFEPFLVEVPGRWASNPSWLIRDDVMTVDSARPNVRESESPVMGTFAVRARLVTAGTAGVHLRETGHVATCQVDHEGHLLFAVDGMVQKLSGVLSPNQVVDVTVATNDGVAGMQLVCRAGNATLSHAPLPSPTWKLGVIGDQATFYALDAVNQE